MQTKVKAIEYNDAIDAKQIEEGLQRAGLSVRVVCKEETGSTNEDAAAAVKDSDKPVLVIADRQLKGRGRRGRDFYSPSGTGIYMSLALKNATELFRTVKVTATAAVAVAEAIDKAVFAGENTSLIKWVNDIYLGKRKVCGILSEAVIEPGTGECGYIVAGIGINVYEPSGGFPVDIENKAGYLIDAGQQAYTGLRNEIITEVIRLFFLYISDQDKMLDIYRAKSNLMGSLIKINSFVPEDRERRIAKVLGIDDDCGLVVEYENGIKETLTSGEVSVVKC